MSEKEIKLFEIVSASGMVHRVKGTHCDIDEVLPKVTVYNQGDIVGSYIGYTALTTLSPSSLNDRVDFDEYVIDHQTFIRAIEQSMQNNSKTSVLANIDIRNLSELKITDVLKVKFERGNNHFTLYVPRK